MVFCRKNRFSISMNNDGNTYFFRAWRKHRGLTQEQLAERLGVSVPAISQLERGKQGFSAESLAKMAVVLECEPGDLLSCDPSQIDVDRELVGLWNRLNDDQKAALKQLALSMIPPKAG